MTARSPLDQETAAISEKNLTTPLKIGSNWQQLPKIEAALAQSPSGDSSNLAVAAQF